MKFFLKNPSSQQLSVGTSSLIVSENVSGIVNTGRQDKSVQASQINNACRLHVRLQLRTVN